MASAIPTGGATRPPSALLALTELPRALAEWGSYAAAAGPLLAAAPRGDGHPVLVLPGFITSDISTGPLRRYLTRLGYDAHAWELGRNLGPRAIGREGELAEIGAIAGPDGARGVELVELDPRPPVRGPHHDDLAPDAVDADQSVHRLTLDHGSTLHLHPECREERDRGLEVVDDYTFTIRTTEPVSNLPVRLGYTAFAPQPDAFFADPESFGKAPIGAGPYQVTEYNDGQSIVVEKFAEVM